MSIDEEEKSNSRIKIELENRQLEDPVYDDAVSEADARPDEAAKKFQSIIDRPIDPEGKDTKLKEESIIRLGRIFAKRGQTKEFQALFTSIRPFFKLIHKSRTGKIVRQLIDVLSEENSRKGKVEDSILKTQVEICENAITWCQEEKRTFLKQRIQTKLSSILVQLRLFNQALGLISQLIRSVKKFDDKLLLVEIFLIESSCHLQLKNIPKSKGALTAARSNANSIYCPPQLQSEIDLQAGILACHEGDFKTAFSYFYESSEGFHTIKNPTKTIQSIKYMILSKIMTGQHDDVTPIVNGKLGTKYQTMSQASSVDFVAGGSQDGKMQIQAMKAITKAHQERNLHLFEQTYQEYKTQLQYDLVIQSHLSDLKDHLLESNLIKIIEPFSKVEISHISKLIRLPRDQIELKLSQMILDNKLNAVIEILGNEATTNSSKMDQEEDESILIVYEEIKSDPVYENAIKTIKQLESVVDNLHSKAQLLHA